MKNTQQIKKRQKRIRAKIKGTSLRPRLSVFRSIRYISAQLIDDEAGKTLFGISEKSTKDLKGSKTEKAKALGLILAQKAKKGKIEKAVFDKGSYKYHGRVKALAEGAREGGLEF